MPRILIIDDHEDVRQVLRALVERQGYDVEVAENGAEALDRCERAMPDLVITDLHMPRLDGLETVRSLRERSDTVKIVSMTGDNSEFVSTNLESSRINGADRAFTKPFDVKEFLDAIAALLSDLQKPAGTAPQ